MSLDRIEDQTREICIRYLSKDGSQLRYVKNQTEELCVIAVKQNGGALMYVKEQTEEICWEAVKNDISSFPFVEIQSERICLFVVRRRGCDLRYVENKTEELCMAALETYPDALEFIRDQNEEICLRAVKSNPYVIRFVKGQTEEMCWIAVRDNGMNLRYVKPSLQSYEMCKIAIEECSHALAFVCDQSDVRLVMIAITKTGLALEHVRDKTKEICLMAIRNNVDALRYVNRYSKYYMEIATEAVRRDHKALRYVLMRKKRVYSSLVLEAVKANAFALADIFPTNIDNLFEVSMAAVKQNPKIMSVKILKKLDNEDYTKVALEAVKRKGSVLKWVVRQTEEDERKGTCSPVAYEEICMEAIIQNRNALKLIDGDVIREKCRRYLEDRRFLRTKSARKVIDS